MGLVKHLAKAVARNRIGIGYAAARVEDDIRPEGRRIGDEKRNDGHDRSGDQDGQAAHQLTTVVASAPAHQEDEQQEGHGQPGERFQGDRHAERAGGQDRVIAGEQHQAQEDGGEELDVVSPRPQIQGDQRADVDRGHHHHAAFRG